MTISFLPDIVLNSVTELLPEYLRNRGVRLLMLDFDNTIVPYTTSVPSEKMKEWLEMISASDIEVCIVSNSHKERVKIFCDKYGLQCITGAKKPFSKGILECLAKFEIPASQAAIAGDQIYTDTLGGNCCGLTTILVKAIHNHNIWLKLRHVAELPFILLSKNRRMNDEKH